MDLRCIRTLNHLNIRVTVHRTDTISVVIGCSFSPVAVDIDGINRLSNALKLIQDRLQRLVNDKRIATPIVMMIVVL